MAVRSQCSQCKWADQNWGTPCPQRESGPETGLEDIKGDLRDADFWPG